MNTHRGQVLALVVTMAMGCAAIDEPDAPAAVEASDDGWVDFAVRDVDVPPDPLAQLTDGSIRPPSCELTVSLDGRLVHSQTLEPVGAAPPYRVESDFRLSVPAGDYGAGVTYSGCRSHARGLDSVEVELPIAVRRRQVTWLRFDGARLEADFPSPATREHSAR